MKEIKFRWISKKTWKLIQWSLIIGNNNKYILTDEEKEYMVVSMCEYSASMQLEMIEDWTEWQYTWLKDKNWKEIYEGDIVRYDDWDNWEIGREEVKFENWAFNICCFHPLQKEFINEPRVIEIIWNIYKNPELLN